MSDVSTWDTSAAGNSSVSPDGFPEGMPPSGVNDSAREVMAAVARWRQAPFDNLVTYNANQTLALTDAGSALFKTAADTVARTWTIPLNASVAFPVGSEIYLFNLDDNNLTITADSTATLRELKNAAIADGDVVLAEGEAAVIFQDATDTWLLWRLGRDPVALTSVTGQALDKAFWPLMENGTDTDHDIEISAGTILSTDGAILDLPSTLIKQLDAAHVVGTNAGGLFSGTVAADTTYHLFLIRRDSDGLIDAGFDTSLSAANIPAGFTSYRRLMSFVTDASSNIRIFTQKDDVFYFQPTTAATNQVISTGPAGTNLTLPVPDGISLEIMLAGVFESTSGISFLYVSHSNQQTESTISAQESHVVSATAPVGDGDAGQSLNGLRMHTNTTRQIRFVSNTSSNLLQLGVVGWVDPRTA